MVYVFFQKNTTHTVSYEWGGHPPFFSQKIDFTTKNKFFPHTCINNIAAIETLIWTWLGKMFESSQIFWSFQFTGWTVYRISFYKFSMNIWYCIDLQFINIIQNHKIFAEWKSIIRVIFFFYFQTCWLQLFIALYFGGANSN